MHVSKLVRRIVTTKLVPPTQRSELIPRTHLVAELSAHIDARLLTVTAPAGYGKTSLLIQLHELLASQGQNVAWLSLDPFDNDVARLASHLFEVIDRSQTRRSDGTSSTESLRGLDSAQSVASLRAELINRLGELDRDLYLFIDDTHLLRQDGPWELLNAPLLAPLDHVHLIIASRDKPKLSLGRLRVLGMLHELDTRALSFSQQETNAFVESNGCPQLSEAQLTQLREKTEGWPASLKLASIAIRGVKDAEEFLSRFSGADRSVSEFLVEEVLSHQDQPLQKFLLATSLFRRFNSGLANAVLQIKDSRDYIDRIESLNLFILSLDRERSWYRYHHLFAGLLRERLLDRDPELAIEYHKRACAYLSESGLTTEAIEHAFSAGDIDLAAALLDEASSELFASGQTSTLEAHSKCLPAAVLRRLPHLQLELAWEYIIQWQFDRAVESLADVESVLSAAKAEPETAAPFLSKLGFDELESRLAHRRLMLDVFGDRLESALKRAASWEERYGQRDAFMSASISVATMMCRRDQFSCELSLANQNLLRQRFIGTGAVYGTVFLDTIGGDSLFTRGEIEAAEQSYRRARATAIKLHGERSKLSAMPSSGLAAVLYERNRVTEAQHLLDELDYPSDFGLVDSTISSQVTLSAIASAEGHTLAAHQALDAATLLADRYTLPRLHAHVFAERVRILIGDGLVRDAERLSRDARYAEGMASPTPTGQASSTQEMYALATARLSCERGEVIVSVNLLKRWFAWTRDRHCFRPAARIGVLLAKLHARGGDRLAARRTLVETLRIGAPGFVRTFVDEGPEIGAIIQELSELESASELPSHHHIAELLAAFGVSQSNPVNEELDPGASGTLSQRELEILRLTSSNLVAHEVAESLGLTESTVKWYWQRIFEKLGVRRRSIALRIARQRGLLG